MLPREYRCANETDEGDQCLEIVSASTVSQRTKYCGNCGSSLLTGKVKSTLISGIELSGPHTLETYKVEDVLGIGGMGQVYKVSSRGSFYALKENVTSFKEPIPFTILKELNHPALPRYYDEFALEKYVYLVMDYIKGQTLHRLIAGYPNGIPEDETLRLMQPVIEATGALHGQKTPIIHRDIKPSNIIVDGLKTFLVDLGIAKHGGVDSRTVLKAFSNGYSPKEQVQGLPTGPFSDIYALGATMYHALTSTPPPPAEYRDTGTEMEDLNKTYLSRRISSQVAGAVMTAVAIDKNDRYQDITSFKKDLLKKQFQGVAVPPTIIVPQIVRPLNAPLPKRIERGLQSLAKPILERIPEGKIAFLMYNDNDFNYADRFAEILRFNNIKPLYRDGKAEYTDYEYEPDGFLKTKRVLTNRIHNEGDLSLFDKRFISRVFAFLPQINVDNSKFYIEYTNIIRELKRRAGEYKIINIVLHKDYFDPFDLAFFTENPRVQRAKSLNNNKVSYRYI
jgi:serine/threonine protein kinase